MVQLKEKTLEELKKMASKKKIEGRSKMNKAQLVRALSKSKKMRGGATLTTDKINEMIKNPSNYRLNMHSSMGNGTTGRLWNLKSIKEVKQLGENIHILDTKNKEYVFNINSNVDLNYDVSNGKFVLHIDSSLIESYNA
jgi:hypothetical protein